MRLIQPLGEVVEADGLLVVGDAGGVAARGDVVGTVVHAHFSQTLSSVEGVQIEDRPCEAVNQQAGAVGGDCLACELRGLIGDLGFKSFVDAFTPAFEVGLDGSLGIGSVVAVVVRIAEPASLALNSARILLSTGSYWMTLTGSMVSSTGNSFTTVYPFPF